VSRRARIRHGEWAAELDQFRAQPAGVPITSE
jgi:hypothetical protein